MTKPLTTSDTPQRHHFTVEEYFALAERGVLAERTELIGGDIYDVSPHSPRHRALTDIVLENFKLVLRGRATVFGQSTLAFEGWSPEPDITVLEFDAERYLERQPTPAEIHLIIEVSDATLARDRGVKLRSYAQQGIREYWIVNLVENILEVYTEPQDERYLEHLTYTFEDALAPAAFPEEVRAWLQPL